METKQPPRLTNEDYRLQPHAPVQVFHGIHPGTIPLHWHEFYELSYVVSGKGEHRLNGSSYPLSSGTIFLLTPADFHELASLEEEPLEIYNVIFTEAMMDDSVYHWLFGGKLLLQAQLEEKQLPGVFADYERMREENGTWREGSEIVIRATLQRLLVDLYRGSAANRIQPTNGTRDRQLNLNLQKALIYIHHHFREDLRLEDAAGQAQYSATYFSECFSKSVGQSFQRYLQNVRMQFAESLLQASSLPVTEICYVSGFNTLGHFERVFRQRKGMSPRQYRNKAEKTEDMQHLS
ncbi:MULTISPECIES: AraC family transcriptional regulator [Paenibacillus]|uniref:AraC family transcriptional regulator n=1 Tax=Paenibacillus lautus TaxID=1401 RepID=A0A1R1AT71_PAELA|nr:AraC family transcriptional regulator [Paenibacillus lautus]OME88754.1 AraC family transcriptional regulator [Paenibacillus lautus]